MVVVLRGEEDEGEAKTVPQTATETEKKRNSWSGSPRLGGYDGDPPGAGGMSERRASLGDSSTGVSALAYGIQIQ